MPHRPGTTPSEIRVLQHWIRNGSTHGSIVSRSSSEGGRGILGPGRRSHPSKVADPDNPGCSAFVFAPLEPTSAGASEDGHRIHSDPRRSTSGVELDPPEWISATRTPRTAPWPAAEDLPASPITGGGHESLWMQESRSDFPAAPAERLGSRSRAGGDRRWFSCRWCAR